MELVMKTFVILVCFTIQLTSVQNRILSVGNYHPHESEDTMNDKVLAVQNYEDSEEYEISSYPQTTETTKKPCLMVVLSNMQNPSMQSLLRKYRYDANGVLIPNSVKYFIKLPQGFRTSPLLVPLNDKTFSPQGGFVRYYKEVPPIPHVW